LLPYAPASGAVALPATTAYVYAPVPPITALTVICEMSCEQNTLVAAVVKVIELALYTEATHNVVSSVTDMYVQVPLN
jgi:hypothetical protein